MQLPGRFNCTYIDKNGEKVTPVMIHRACFGSLERFIGILIENFAGHFPLWLSPRQVIVLPVNNEYHLEYANKVVSVLKEHNIKVELDARDEKLGYRIREAQMGKVNYQVVIGDAERDTQSVKVRKYGETEQVTYTLDEFVKMLENEIATKAY